MLNYRIKAVCFASDLEDELNDDLDRSFDIASLFNAEADNVISICWDDEALENTANNIDDANDYWEVELYNDRLLVMRWLKDHMPTNITEIMVELGW